MSRSIFDTKASKSLSAWVIMRGARMIGTIRAHYGGSRIIVEVHDLSNDGCEVQRSTASGGGYDKFTSALAGMTLNGVEFSDHCGDRIKKTSRNTVKGNIYQGDFVTETRLFPRDYKPRKGYRLANFQSGCKRVRNTNDDGTFSHWTIEDCENAIEGYSDCYKIAGIEFLSHIGYNVIQAI